MDTGRPTIVRASEGTPCFVVAADVDADLAAAYSVPHVCRSRSAALWIPDWYFSETGDYHTSTSIAKDGNVECLEHGLTCAHAVHKETRERQARKRCGNDIRELESCLAHAKRSRMTSVQDASHGEESQLLQETRLPLELINDFSRSPSATAPWLSFAKWLTMKDDGGPMRAVPPGFRDPNMETKVALSVLRRRLKDEGMKDLRAGPGFWPRFASVKVNPRRSGQRAKDVSKLIMHGDYRSKPADTSHDCKANTIIWVALHEAVVDIVNARAIDEMFTYGVLRVVAGVGFHHQTLQVAPRISQLPSYCVDGRERATMQSVIHGTELITLTLADFHHYNFLYSCFAAAALELGADDIGSTQIQFASQPSPRHVA